MLARLVVGLGYTIRFALGAGIPLAGAAAVVVGVGELTGSAPLAAVVAGVFALVYDHRRA